MYLPVRLLLDGLQQHLDLIQLPRLLLRLALIELGGAGGGLDLQVDAQLFRDLREFCRDDLAEPVDDLGRVLILDEGSDGLRVAMRTC